MRLIMKCRKFALISAFGRREMEEKLKQFSELDFELRHFGGSLLVASRNVFFFCSRLSIELENYFSGSLVKKLLPGFKVYQNLLSHIPKKVLDWLQVVKTITEEECHRKLCKDFYFNNLQIFFVEFRFFVSYFFKSFLNPSTL